MASWLAALTEIVCLVAGGGWAGFSQISIDFDGFSWIPCHTALQLGTSV